MTAEGADAAGTGRFTLDTRLSGALGGRTSQALERAFGYRTVGDLLGHYPRRYALRGELTALASLPLDENVTIVAEVLEVRERTMRSRRGSILEAKISDGTGILTLTFFNQAWRARELVPGARGIFAGKVGDYKGARQLAHPDYELFDDAAPLAAGDAAAKRWAEAPIPIYPATGTLASWQLAKSIALLLDGLGDVDDPVPAAVRAGAHAARPAARPRGDPPPGGRGRLEGGAAHAALHRGVRAADRAAAAPGRAARAHDDRAASVGRRAARALRRLAAVLAHRRPAGGRRRDRRRPRAPGADEPAHPGRGGLGQDRRRPARDAGGGRLRWPVGAARPHRGARGAAPPLDRPHARSRPVGVGRADAAHGPAARRRAPEGPAARRGRPVAHRGRHARAHRRRRVVRRPRARRRRRAAPVRRRAARGAAPQGAASAARARAHRHAHSAHRRDDGVRRPRRLHDPRAPGRPRGHRVPRGAARRPSRLATARLGAPRRGGRAGPAGIRRVPGDRGPCRRGRRRGARGRRRCGSGRARGIRRLGAGRAHRAPALRGQAGRAAARPHERRREGCRDAGVRRRARSTCSSPRP